MESTDTNIRGRWPSYAPALIAALIIISVPLRYGNLNQPLFCHGDEALTALRSLGLMEQGHYWTPYWNGEPNLHKPPLYYWLVTLCYKTFGITVLSARLPSVVAYLALLALVYFMTRRISAPWTACLAVGLLAFHPFLYEQSRWATIDTLMILLYIAGGYCLWRTPDRTGWYYGWGLACGLAIMAKGIGASLGYLISIAYLLIAQRAAFRAPHFYLALLAGALLPAIWFASQYIMHPEHLISGYLHHEIEYRLQHSLWQSFLSQITTHRLWDSWGALAPIAFAAPFLLFLFRDPASGKLLLRETGPRAWYFMLFLVVTLIGTNLIREQNNRYILPALVPMAVMLAMVADAAARNPSRIPRIVVLALLCAGLLMTKPFEHLPASRTQLAVALALCGAAWLLDQRWTAPSRAILWLALGVTIFLGVSPKSHRIQLTQPRDCADIYHLARLVPPTNEVPAPLVVNFRYYHQNALLFYSNRRRSVDIADYRRNSRPPGAIAYAVLDDRRDAALPEAAMEELARSGPYRLLRLTANEQAAP